MPCVTIPDQISQYIPQSYHTLGLFEVMFLQPQNKRINAWATQKHRNGGDWQVVGEHTKQVRESNPRPPAPITLFLTTALTGQDLFTAKSWLNGYHQSLRLCGRHNRTTVYTASYFCFQFYINHMNLMLNQKIFALKTIDNYERKSFSCHCVTWWRQPTRCGLKAHTFTYCINNLGNWLVNNLQLKYWIQNRA